jgi:hypothetical protein
MPASSAKQVASMFLGVILANKTDIGRKINAMLTVSSTVSVKISSARSGIPYFKFWRKTNMNYRGTKITPMKNSIRINVRISKVLKYF